MHIHSGGAYKEARPLNQWISEAVRMQTKGNKIPLSGVLFSFVWKPRLASGIHQWCSLFVVNKVGVYMINCLALPARRRFPSLPVPGRSPFGSSSYTPRAGFSGPNQRIYKRPIQIAGAQSAIWGVILYLQASWCCTGQQPTEVVILGTCMLGGAASEGGMSSLRPECAS